MTNESDLKSTNGSFEKSLLNFPNNRYQLIVKASRKISQIRIKNQKEKFDASSVNAILQKTLTENLDANKRSE